VIRINEKWVILINGDRLTVAEDYGDRMAVRQDDGAFVSLPRYVERQSYSTLHSAINGVCSYMTLRELAEEEYSLAEALQITHDLYTMVNDSIKEALRAKG